MAISVRLRRSDDRFRHTRQLISRLALRPALSERMLDLPSSHETLAPAPIWKPTHTCALLSDPGRVSTSGPLRCVHAVLTCSNVKDLGNASISGLNHTARCFAVYASCRPHGRRRKTRLRLVANLCRPDFHRVGFSRKFQIRFSSSHHSLSMDLSWRNRTTTPGPCFFSATKCLITSPLPFHEEK